MYSKTKTIAVTNIMHYNQPCINLPLFITYHTWVIDTVISSLTIDTHKVITRVKR